VCPNYPNCILTYPHCFLTPSLSRNCLNAASRICAQQCMVHILSDNCMFGHNGQTNGQAVAVAGCRIEWWSNVRTDRRTDNGVREFGRQDRQTDRTFSTILLFAFSSSCITLVLFNLYVRTECACSWQFLHKPWTLAFPVLFWHV